MMSIMPWPYLTPTKEPPIPIGEEVGWAPELVWMQRLQERLFAPAGERIPNVKSILTLY
jgi:hypothetical protein